MDAPIPDSYWAAERLLAGPLPAHPDREILRAQLRALLDAGIRTVIDLRTPAEPPSMRALLEKLAGPEQDVAWIGAPILDGSAPSVALMQIVLDLIDSERARDRGVYVHCAGGRGRTGTVIACWWIRHGLCDAQGALAALREHRALLPSGAMPSPETGAQ